MKGRISKLLPRRKPATHKGDYGRVLIVAGSPGMTGAAVLAARGALRSGAGLTYLAVPRNLVNFVDSMTPEVITLPFEKIKNIKADAIAIGPGLGVTEQTKKLLSSLVLRPTPLVIDADALNVISKDLNILKKAKAKAKVIITPHPGEMSRLIKRSVEYVQKNRVSVAKEVAQRLRCMVVLKGYKTVMAHPSGRSFTNPTGNPGMASGGVGDVLTGMLAGFLAQGIAAWEASVLAVYLHGLAGDLAAKEKNQHGVIASDLVEKIPYAIRKIH
ncbi:MAG: NAD(P)H-hydrate dehydratase [Candidatus Margulisiibacteriota bacterium]